MSHVAALRSASIPELLRSRAAGEAVRLGYTFLVDGETDEQTVTWQELDQRARTIAARLCDAVPRGERVVLVYPPGLEFIAAFLGCLCAGTVAVCVPIPHPGRLRNGLGAVEAICRDARPRVALSTESFAAEVADAIARPAGLRAVPWVITDDPVETVAGESRQHDPHPDDVAYLQYTSGSTATPKGVMVTHANMLANCEAMRRAMGVTGDDVFVSWLPMFHDMGLLSKVVLPLYVGARSVLMSPVSFLQRPVRWLQAITRHRATISVSPNFAFDLCARKVDERSRATLDLSSWSLAGSGSEPVRHRTIERFSEAFRSCGFDPQAFYPTYGLAEATLMVSANPRALPPRHCTIRADDLERGRVSQTTGGDGPYATVVSCGRAVADTRIVIANPETYEPCRPDQIGEVWIAGPGVTRGYWRRPEETRDTFHARLSKLDTGSFLRTGDLGFIRGGELYLVGRLKDVMVIDGRNHHPQDVELTIAEACLPLRPGCCVAFSLDVNDAEVVVVVAEVDPMRISASNSTVLDMVRVIRAAVASQHQFGIHEVVLVQPGSVPKTSSGKLRRHACRAEYQAGRLPRWSP